MGESLVNYDVGCPDLMHVLVNKPLPGQADCSQISVFWNGCAIVSHWKQQCALQTFRLISDSLQTSPGLGFWLNVCIHTEVSGLLYGKWKEYTELQHHVSRTASLHHPIADPWHFCRAPWLSIGAVHMLGMDQVNNFPKLGPLLLMSGEPSEVAWCVNAQACSFPGLENVTRLVFNL